MLKIVRRLKLQEILASALPKHGNEKVPTADTLLVLMFNIVAGRHPLYELGEWTERHHPVCFGLNRIQKGVFHDDRFGLALDKLSGMDRASLMTEIVLAMAREFNLDFSRIHNDSTTLKAYGKIPGKTRDGLELKKGHSKDHRPDLKQLLFCLSIAADGAVPVHFKTYAGNRTDDTTHIETWKALRNIIGRPDFLYVADCKVCTNTQLGFIVGEEGRIISIVPRTWKPIKRFEESLRVGKVIPKKIIWRRQLPRDPNRMEYFSVFQGRYLTKRGYKIYWIYSNEKRQHDRFDREKALLATEKDLTQMMAKLNTRALKTKTQIQNRLNQLLEKRGMKRFYLMSLQQVSQKVKVQIGKGRPGPDTKYKIISNKLISLSWARDKLTLQKEQRVDGVFPLLSTDLKLSAKTVLKAYKYQPRLEKRFNHLKEIHKGAPLLFKKIHRVESIMWVFFIALMVQALLEREIRLKMKQHRIQKLFIYPEFRASQFPTTSKVLALFEDISVYRLRKGNSTVKQYRDSLHPVQRKVIKLLGVSEDQYWDGASL